MEYVFLNHHPVPREQAMVPISDRGFRFGDGVFETLRVHKGVPCYFEWHMERLTKGLAAIKLALPTPPLMEECRQLLAMNQFQSGLLRIQVTRGTTGSGYLPAPGNPTCVIETVPLPKVPTEPITLFLSSYRRMPESSLPVQAKLAQGLNSTLARMEANAHGCFEALQLNQQGIVCEGSSSNIFWLNGNALYTPALDAGVLDGSTRAAIMRYAPFTVHEAIAEPEALMEASAVCVCNVAWDVLAVAALLPQGNSWDNTSIASLLNQLLADDREAYAKNHRGLWQKT